MIGYVYIKHLTVSFVRRFLLQRELRVVLLFSEYFLYDEKRKRNTAFLRNQNHVYVTLLKTLGTLRKCA